MNWLKQYFPWYKENKMEHLGTIRQTLKLDESTDGQTVDLAKSLEAGAPIPVAAVGEGPQPAPEPVERKGAHVMVDIETWGTGPAAIPISIGAVKFYPQEEPFGWGERFYAAIDPQSAALCGLQMDVGTMTFWMGRNQRAALDDWLDAPKEDLGNVLTGFAMWYGEKELPTWCRGPDFDAVILNTAYKVCGMERPWSHQKNRDVRTVQGLMDWSWKNPRMAIEPSKEGLKHNALDDAIYQTLMIQGIVEALGLRLR